MKYSFLRNESGSVTIEMALIVPVLVFIVWFGAEAAYHQRLQNKLHRATATIADILANREIDEDATLPQYIPAELSSSLLMLETMLGGSTAGDAGMVVSYLATPLPGAVGQPSQEWAAGSACQGKALQSLDDLGLPGGLITEENVSKAELVRVEACVKLKDRWNFSRVVFPDAYTSHFVTIRKEW